MVYALSWFFVAALVALWSLAAWALHALVAWALSNADAISGVAAGAGRIPWPDWLAPWVTPDLAPWLTGLLDTLLQAAPALAGGLTVATWVVWGLGCALILLLGLALHALIALWRRRGGHGSGPGAGAPLAAG